MKDLYKNKYRIKSTRLKNWDYGSNGYYYVTICVNNRENEYWRGIPGHFPFVKLDKYIIMPNHVHGIIVIDKNKFGPQSKNLASIICGFKIGVKKYATINNIHFQWESRFYEHLVRDENDLNCIREYIINNPNNWQDDDNSKDEIRIVEGRIKE